MVAFVKVFGVVMLGTVALGGCAPREDACAASGYNQNVCADEQSRRAAALSILGNMRAQQPAPYQVPMPQTYYPPQTSCTSMPNGAGGFYTTCQ